ncbi:hypothetical protein WDV85_02570 [Pseudokineococcus sp. 5B2Z-1]|uniref:glycosyltransferase n=1 Tax=Pseudokineococcus sp. 5B2Z-1 TaxID=3132744 RepID=UPI0030B46020
MAAAAVVVAPIDSLWAERARRAGALVLPPAPPSAIVALLAEADERDEDRSALGELAAERADAFVIAVRRALAPVTGEARLPPELSGAISAAPQRRVLLMSSNGSGMGHLTRLTAMARRADPRTDVHVLSLSSAVTAGAAHLPHVYVPSARDMGISPRRWDRVLERRLAKEVERLRPDVLVFDGTHPYPALVELARRRDAPRLVWSRRPMWRPGHGAEDLLLSRRFDLVIEPGELAATHDRGLTRGRGDALVVRPVLLLDPDEALPRPEARRELGVEGEGPTALVMLGAGRWYDAVTHQREVVDVLSQAVRDVQVLVARPRIAEGEPDLGAARAVSVQPLARVMAGIDLVVTAAGYNTFHETVAAGRPGAYAGVPAQRDDQPQRAGWAHDAGVGLDLGVGTPQAASRLREAARLLADEAAREAVEARCRDVWPGNGAADAMRAVEALADGADGGELVAATR